MNLIDFNDCKLLPKAYGGAACRKLCIEYNGEPYLLKFATNLKIKNLKNINLSYSNSPISEYISSHIYQSVGIDTHETLLGFRGGRLVVACKDFLNPGENLFEFSQIKITNEEEYLDSSNSPTDGTGLDIDEILQVIHNDHMLKNLSNVEDRFWKMFVVDAFIGNADRNNGNWGIIVNYNSLNNYTVRLAPVYDNGSSLNEKWDDEKILKFLSDQFLFFNEAYKGKLCVHTLHNKRVNPFQIMESNKYKKLSNALEWVLSRLDMKYVKNLISTNPLLNNLQIEFLNKILDVRYNHLVELINSTKENNTMNLF